MKAIHLSQRSASRQSIFIALFIIALLPRLFGLNIFITSDEPLWVVRAIAFSEAILTGDWAETLQTGHPGVTTMQSGSLGLYLAYVVQMRDASAGTMALSFTEFLQSLPHKPERIEATLLPWMRLPTVVLAALCVALIYLWASPLLGTRIACLGALLLAFDPLFLAHSRTLHHDALVTIFSILSLLTLFHYAQGKQSFLVISAVLAGFALLSKGTALVLIAFIGLFFAWLWLNQGHALAKIVRDGLIWLGLSCITFSLSWPAMWVDPSQVLQAVFGWVITAADSGSVDETALLWPERVLDLGPLFYPVNWLLKSTPLSLLGLLGLIRGRQKALKFPQVDASSKQWLIPWLSFFALIFLIFLTLGDKRDGRYLLPIYPGLWLVTALGLLRLENWWQRLVFSSSPTLKAMSFPLLVSILLLAFSLPWYPYYHTYYNPLLGGSWLAPRLVKVGWGEGMEKVAAYLHQQPNPDRLTVATSYAQNFLPFFAGQWVKHHHDDPSDYVLNYVRQIQNGYPYPEYWQYYQAREPVYHLKLGRIDYAWLYKTSSLGRVGGAEFDRGLTLLGYTFKPVEAVGHPWMLEPGQKSHVTLVWRATESIAPGTMAQVTLLDERGQIWGQSEPAPILDPLGPSAVEGHYTLTVSSDAPRLNAYLQVTVTADQPQSLGQATLGLATFGDIPIRRISLPQTATSISPPPYLADLLSLRGYHLPQTTFAPGDSLEITLYWQAQAAFHFDYTVFVQLQAVSDTETSSGDIQGQHDSQPMNGQLPTSQWTVGEIVADTHQFQVAPTAPAGTYQLLVGLYRWDTGERLPLRTLNDVETSISDTAIRIPKIQIQ